MSGSFLCWYLPVEFWWCLKNHGPPNMHFCSSVSHNVGVLRSWETGLLGAHKTTQKAQMCILGGPASNTTNSTRMLKERIYKSTWLQKGQINLAEEKNSTLAMLGGLAKVGPGVGGPGGAGEGGPRENGWREEEEGRERRSSERKQFPIIFAS